VINPNSKDNTFANFVTGFTECHIWVLSDWSAARYGEKGRCSDFGERIVRW